MTKLKTLNPIKFKKLSRSKKQITFKGLLTNKKYTATLCKKGGGLHRKIMFRRREEDNRLTISFYIKDMNELKELAHLLNYVKYLNEDIRWFEE